MLVATAIVGLGAATIGSVGIASAATTTGTEQPSIVDKISTTFGLKKADVQNVFDEDRTSHQAKRQAKAADKLAELVKDGKLTQDQADKLTAKSKEIQALREANRDIFKDKTEEERKTLIDKQRADLKQWLSDNKIDEQYARFLFGGPGRHMRPGGPVKNDEPKETHRGMMDGPSQDN